jgi:metal-responsive CopG/Arc/MetJ family transcriptional regulator
MTRTTVTLPEDLVLLLAREARRHDTSVSEIVRRAVASFMGVSGGQRRELPFAALGRSGRRHTARDAEKILTAEWGRARRR